jgi:hypothetical protein
MSVLTRMSSVILPSIEMFALLIKLASTSTTGTHQNRVIQRFQIGLRFNVRHPKPASDRLLCHLLVGYRISKLK